MSRSTESSGTYVVVGYDGSLTMHVEGVSLADALRPLQRDIGPSLDYWIVRGGDGAILPRRTWTEHRPLGGTLIVVTPPVRGG